MQSRLFRIPRTGHRAEEMIFDGYADEISLSPDGKKLLFTVGGSRLYRRGYTGSHASRIWLRDLETGAQELLPHSHVEAGWIGFLLCAPN